MEKVGRKLQEVNRKFQIVPDSLKKEEESVVFYYLELSGTLQLPANFSYGFSKT